MSMILLSSKLSTWSVAVKGRTVKTGLTRDEANKYIDEMQHCVGNISMFQEPIKYDMEYIGEPA